MKTPLVFLSMCLAYVVPILAQNTSIYTDLSDTKCKTLKLREDEGGSYLGECRGVAGYKLNVLEGDLRQSIDVITPRGKRYELNLWNVSGGFSSVGPTAEWRMKGRKPVALIVRYNVSENPEETSKLTSYLVVVKLTNNEICITSALKPTRLHNSEARKAADKAATQPCRFREPEK
jgi:hypothetical protein